MMACCGVFSKKEGVERNETPVAEIPFEEFGQKGKSDGHLGKGVQTEKEGLRSGANWELRITGSLVRAGCEK